MELRLIETWGAARANAENAQTERVVSDCMHEHGWQKFKVMPIPQVEQPLGASLTRREFAQQMGFGVVTQIVTPASSTSLPAPQAPVDPNASWVAALSATERNQYELDLVGDPLDDSHQVPNCNAVAADMTALPPSSQRIVDHVAAMLAELEQRIGADPAVTAQQQAYAQCVARGGFPEMADRAAFSAILQSKVSAEMLSDVSSHQEDLKSAVDYERRAAIVDLDCYTPLLRTRSEVGLRLAEVFRKDYQGDLVRFVEIMKFEQGDDPARK